MKKFIKPLIIIIAFIAVGYYFTSNKPEDNNGGLSNQGAFFECPKEGREVVSCAKEAYKPVCAKVNVQCITTPCDPVSETFPTACSACKNPLVSGYTEGSCGQEGGMPSKPGLIYVSNIEEGQVVESPLVIEGEVRGYWFFEASFPLILTDWDGRIIAQSYASAEANWMTEEMVPFKGKIEFENPENIGEFSRRGALILRKDNPSGLPEYDDVLEIPIFFK